MTSKKSLLFGALGLVVLFSGRWDSEVLWDTMQDLALAMAVALAVLALAWQQERSADSRDYD